MNSLTKQLYNFDTNVELTEEQQKNLEVINKFNKNILKPHCDNLKNELDVLINKDKGVDKIVL